MSFNKDIFSISRDNFFRLHGLLSVQGYRIIGPSIQDNAVVYKELGSFNELPAGWTDAQEKGEYRLKKRDDNALFGYTVGPHSWKKFLYPPLLKLWESTRDETGFSITRVNAESPNYVFLGVRACELEAISILDTIFLKNEYIDPVYKSIREKTFIIAVNCTEPGATCFCGSMNTGPWTKSVYDLALTEIIRDENHYFLAETGSEMGVELCANIPHQATSEHELSEARKLREQAEQRMGRTLDTINIKEMLYANIDHPQWEIVAKRCLSCGNCTMVCPTCFCMDITDKTDIKGTSAERWRTWDTCFSVAYSYIHGGSVRYTTASRYRQWLMHKLATWIDQFGRSGCVGCGRCITWCPAGIDITEELHSIRNSKNVSRLTIERKENNAGA